jgi:hypothetical protein
MNHDAEILATLREIRDDQRQLLEQIKGQRALAELQMTQSRQRIDESMGLQREALRACSPSPRGRVGAQSG